jgi:hypothetical protein
MTQKFRILGLVFLLDSAARLPLAKADEVNHKTTVTLSASIAVPGTLLPTGQYVFELADSQLNRDIVNWFEPIGASPKPTFREYNATPAELKSGKPSLIIAAFPLASLPTGLEAQSETPRAKNTMSASLGPWNAMFEVRETQSGKSSVPESKPMLQPGILQVPEQASAKPLSIGESSTSTPRSDRKSWIGVGPGSLPLATTNQPDATQKYGADPATLRVYFGHRR